MISDTSLLVVLCLVAAFVISMILGAVSWYFGSRADTKFPIYCIGGIVCAIITVLCFALSGVAQGIIGLSFMFSFGGYVYGMYLPRTPFELDQK